MFPSLVALSLALPPAPRPLVLVQALIVSVDTDFASNIGWTKPDVCRTDHGAMEAEIQLLVRAAKAAGKLDVLSRPSLVMEQDQEGYFSVGEGGKYVPEVIEVRTVAKVLDGGAFKLKVDTKHVVRNGSPRDGAVAFDTEQVQATVTVSAGTTACLQIGRAAGKKTVRLAFLSAHLVFTEPPAATTPPVAAVNYAVPLPARAISAPNPFITKPAPVPTLMPAAAQPKPPVLKPAPEPTTLPELLAAYRAACDRQDGMAASRLAVKALALDPTCFK